MRIVGSIPTRDQSPQSLHTLVDITKVRTMHSKTSAKVEYEQMHKNNNCSLKDEETSIIFAEILRYKMSLFISYS